MLWLILSAIFLVGSVTSLNLEETEEGSCQKVQFHPVKDIDYNFLAGDTYMPAASRYNLYRVASSHPRFRQMREFELLNNMCLLLNSHNATETMWYGSAKGFGGRLLGRYVFTPRQNQSTVIDVSHQFPSNAGGSSGSGKPFNGTGLQTVTLTDHKTFAFFGNCWYDTNQRSWEVVANTPELSSSAKWLITQHATTLGFNREDIIFLNYKSCGNLAHDNDDGDNFITTTDLSSSAGIDGVTEI